MATVQLLGRETYPNRRPYGYGISPLWQRVPVPPYQESIIIYDDDTVVRGIAFTQDQIAADDVYMFILGGSRFRCETGSKEYLALTSAGFTWQTIPNYDSYPAEYTDNYP
jgi:hypothetical protein